MTITGVVLGLLLGTARRRTRRGDRLPARRAVLDHSLVTSLGLAIAVGAWSSRRSRSSSRSARRSGSASAASGRSTSPLSAPSSRSFSR